MYKLLMVKVVLVLAVLCLTSCAMTDHYVYLNKGDRAFVYGDGDLNLALCQDGGFKIEVE